MPKSRSAPVSAYDLKAFRALVEEMRKLQVFHVKLGELEVQMSQYAFVPKPEVLPPSRPLAPPEPIEAYPELTAPFQAFRPWTSKPPKKEPVDTAPYDPTDPNGPLDDNALFASDLPLEQ